MRKLFILVSMFLLLLSFVQALPVEDVKLDYYVNDYTNTLTSSQIDTIQTMTQGLHQENIAEIAVLIVDNFDGLTKEEYAITVAHENLGDTELDNGLLILVGLEEREYRFEVGYGLEGVLNDAKMGRIGRQVLVPYFQQGEYGEGLVQAVQAIGYELSPEGIPAPVGYTIEEDNSIFYWWMITIIIFVIIRSLSYAQYRKKHYTKSNDKDAEDALVAAMFTSWFFRPPRGGFGGGGSGGFGGFGGGGFGGGGAGGGW